MLVRVTMCRGYHVMNNHNLFFASRLFGVQSCGSKRPRHISYRPGYKKPSRELGLNDRRDTLNNDPLSVHLGKVIFMLFGQSLL